MTDGFDCALGVIFGYLNARFDQQTLTFEADGTPKKNGRFFLEWIIHTRRDGLPCDAEPEVVILTSLCSHLEQGYQFEGERLIEGGSDWGRGDTLAVFKKGDFLLDTENFGLVHAAEQEKRHILQMR